jgi:hypothetical protein
MHTWVHRSVEPDGLGAVSDVLAELVVGGRGGRDTGCEDRCA